MGSCVYTFVYYGIHFLKGEGGLHENFSEIIFLIVSDRAEATVIFQILFLAEVIAGQRSEPIMCNYIACAIFDRFP